MVETDHGFVGCEVEEEFDRHGQSRRVHLFGRLKLKDYMWGCNTGAWVYFLRALYG